MPASYRGMLGLGHIGSYIHPLWQDSAAWFWLEVELNPACLEDCHICFELTVSCEAWMWCLKKETNENKKPDLSIKVTRNIDFMTHVWLCTKKCLHLWKDPFSTFLCLGHLVYGRRAWDWAKPIVFTKIT